jgi:hypothetical protein
MIQETHTQGPSMEESEALYRLKLSRVNIPVTIKTGDQAQGLRELVQSQEGAKKFVASLGLYLDGVEDEDEDGDDYKPWSGITIREEKHFNDNRFFIYENGVTVGSIDASAPRVAELFQLAIMEHVRPATDETFAQVKADMGGGR